MPEYSQGEKEVDRRGRQMGKKKKEEINCRC